MGVKGAVVEGGKPERLTGRSGSSWKATSKPGLAVLRGNEGEEEGERATWGAVVVGVRIIANGC